MYYFQWWFILIIWQQYTFFVLFCNKLVQILFNAKITLSFLHLNKIFIVEYEWMNIILRILYRRQCRNWIILKNTRTVSIPSKITNKGKKDNAWIRKIQTILCLLIVHKPYVVQITNIAMIWPSYLAKIRS